jgi:hypothetical protein
MSPRLLYLLSAEHAPACERDRIDAWTAAARMPGRRRPRWARVELALAA